MATLRKAKPAAERWRQLRGLRVPRPPPPRVTRGGPVLPVSGTSWPAHRPGMPRPRHAPARCRQCLKPHISIHVKFARYSHEIRTNTPLCPRPPTGSACSARPARSAGVAVRGALGGGGAHVPFGAPFPLARGGGFVLLDVNDVSHHPLPLPPHMDAHGKPCHVHPLRPPLLPTREHIQPTNPSRRHRPLIPDPRHPRLHPPVPTHKPVGKHAHQLLPRRQVGPPPGAQWGRERRCGGCPAPPATPTPCPTRH